MNDPIVEEVRKARDEYAARFNYDLDAMVKDLNEQEKRSGRVIVKRPAKADVTAQAVPAKPLSAGTAPAQPTP